MLLSPSPGTYWWPEINQQTILPAVCCCRPAGPFEGNSRYGQPKPCFTWRMTKSLMVLVETWETCCVCGETVSGEACVASKATQGAVLLSEDGLHPASISCVCKGTFFLLQLMVRKRLFISSKRDDMLFKICLGLKWVQIDQGWSLV